MADSVYHRGADIHNHNAEIRKTVLNVAYTCIH